MRVQFDPEFYKLYKEANVRIRNEIDRKIALFKKEILTTRSLTTTNSTMSMKDSEVLI